MSIGTVLISDRALVGPERQQGAQTRGRVSSTLTSSSTCPGAQGTPRSSLPLTQIIDQACQEAEAYKDAGVDGLIVENMHDLPYTVCPGPEVTAAMTVISAAVRQTCPHLALGVQILCAANQQAVAVALAAGLDFIRAEGFVFSHVADEGIINACAGNLLRYRKQVGAENIQIFADIKKKHSGEDEEMQSKHSTRWITNVCAESNHRVRSCCLQCSCSDGRCQRGRDRFGCRALPGRWGGTDWHGYRIARRSSGAERS
ncbi:PREDICTED: uncharacterized protein F13E9.13, mitochondrial-like isoform X5 [Haliaeetus leucocephalus]|uniref:uncharacterized protein F13E9.13, mitochondrial-like isoform X5 n=1 Tax=Haliaeetus leucocephalus TaxID=52644 RepID=UPI00053CCB3A|nr:PREDICTED: uncharacterized protein F13E9.13, mitochondrial-like isoform X5 [Haliaeetus leucocephalus]